MFKIKGNDLYVTRGDTIIFDFVPMYKDGSQYVPHLGDHLIFTVKEKLESSPVINYEIPLDTFEVRLEHEATDNLKLNTNYMYDIQLITQHEFVDTFMSGKLYIMKEVGTWANYETRNSN